MGEVLSLLFLVFDLDGRVSRRSSEQVPIRTFSYLFAQLK